jgi:hypothetical protein
LSAQKDSGNSEAEITQWVLDQIEILKDKSDKLKAERLDGLKIRFIEIFKPFLPVPQIQEQQTEKKRRIQQIDALIETIIGMGLNPLSLVVGDGVKKTIHEKCLEDHAGEGLFTSSKDTFNGIWKDAASVTYGEKLKVINSADYRF